MVKYLLLILLLIQVFIITEQRNDIEELQCIVDATENAIIEDEYYEDWLADIKEGCQK